MSVSAAFLWRFLDDVWDLLPTDDRRMFETYWSAQIQIAANLEQKVLEVSQSKEISEVPVFLTERWNRFAMDEDTTDRFDTSDTLTMVGTDAVRLSHETAFFDTLTLSSESGQIFHEETMRFFDNSVHQLRYGKLVPGTLSLKLDGFEYAPNRDYVVNLELGTVQALDDGRIPPDALLTVNYWHGEYSLDLDYVVDELRGTVARTSDSTIVDGGQAVARYTYNATATLPFDGAQGSITDATILTDDTKDFGNLLPGRTLVVANGANAGTYTINSVISPTQVQIAESFLAPQPVDVVYSINAFPHAMKVNKAIVSIPYLQNRIDDPSSLMIEGIDFLVRDGILASRSPFRLSTLGPVENRTRQMWAEITKIDAETPYRNFGVLIDFFRKNSEEYKLALQGLWYTFWTGSTPGNLQRGLHILLGLPFAKRAGTVTRVDTALGQIDLTDPRGQIITYTIPSGLDPVVAKGDEVPRFNSLTTGVSIIDRNNEPGFVEARLGRAGIQKFLTSKATRGGGDTDETKALRLLENHLFLPQVLTEAIAQRVNVGELVTFLDHMKPNWTEYVFSFAAAADETVLVGEDLEPVEIAMDISTTVGNNEWNQSFQFGNFIVNRSTGEILAGGTQATGNFRDSGVDFSALGVGAEDYIRITDGLYQGYWRVLDRISSSTLALDIPDADIVGTTNIDYVALSEELRLDHDAVGLGRENIVLNGTAYATPSGLNTKTDIDFSSLTLTNEDAKALLLIDLTNAGAEVQAITDADLANQEIDVATPPAAPASQDHQIASCALVRTDNTGPTVTDAYAI